jgi:hypothetical protein
MIFPLLPPLLQVSAASADSGSSSIYGEDIPPEVVSMLEARRVADKLQTR